MKLQSLFHHFYTFDRSAKLFLLSTFLYGIALGGWGLFFNLYILERGFDREFLGLVNAIPSFSILLLGIPIGALSDRIGQKRAMLLGAGISIACMGLEVTVLNSYLILFMAFLNGLGSSLYFFSQAPFMAKVSNQSNRTLLFSLNFGFMTLSMAIGNLVAGRLPSFFESLLNLPPQGAIVYQAALLMSVFLSLFTILPLALLHEPKGSPGMEGRIRTKVNIGQAIFRLPTFKLVLPILLLGGGAAILLPYMNVFFVERFTLSDQDLGYLFSLSSVMTGLGSFFGPRLTSNLKGKIHAIVVAQGVSLIFLLLIGFSPYLWLASTSFLLRATFMNIGVPLYRAFAMEQVQHYEQGTVNSVIELSWQIGWAVGPYVSGLMQEVYGFKPLFIATGVLYALSTVSTWVFFEKQERVSAMKTTAPKVVSCKGDCKELGV